CGWYLFADIVSRTARILGKPDESETYARLASQIRDNFNAKCFDPATGLYAKAADSQTSLILPLCLDMVPEGKRELILKRLVENIGQWKDHLSTGFIGTPYLLEGLPEFGLADLSYKIVNQQDYAGWNTLITEGVMKETWRGGMAQMPSLGGSIGQWFYKAAAGIRPDPDGPGFRKIIIKPSIMGDLTWVKAHYDSSYGRIVSNWKREGARVSMEVTIPINTTATVYVPSKDAAGVTESDKPAAKAAGVKFLRMENGAAVYEVGSGSYRFQAETNATPWKPHESSK
ncbi:MAG: alpha-L-rhamnosidase C-terminal domain-containing protein, partial [Verrucomicrobiales bacterium]